MSLNKIMLIGHVGKDPDIRDVSGTKVATFTFATMEKGYTLQNGTHVPDRTEWHNIVLWRGLAEVVAKHVHKGDKLYIEGKIRTRSYDDSNGVKRYITEVFGDHMEMLSIKPVQPRTDIPSPPYQTQSSANSYQQRPFQQPTQANCQQQPLPESPANFSPNDDGLPF